ncbi:Epididymal secretory protein E1 [Thelohanellus kitauei]|uniref:Epididymal secretory protein E1 n=1 Tax=Thelohanellus kitauei TaxID=669202 RepID=A0A0C2JZF2_THEKT|nr:Epididymal secretory protein E1 [Thelohanellus kitauei]
MLALLISACLFLHCSSLIKKCPNTVTHGTLILFKIDGCKMNKCVFHSGHHMTGSVRFIPHTKSDKLLATMSAKIGQHHFIMPDFKGNGCRASGVNCTIVPNEPYVYRFSAIIPYVVMATKTMIRFTLSNDNNAYLVCVEVPVEFRP